MSLFPKNVTCPVDKLLVVSTLKISDYLLCRLTGQDCEIKDEVYHNEKVRILPTQSINYLSLNPMHIEVNLKSALSADGKLIDISTSFVVVISKELKDIAGKRLIGSSERQIKDWAKDLIIANLRLTLALTKSKKMKIKTDKNELLDKLMSYLKKELKILGIVPIQINIKELTIN